MASLAGCSLLTRAYVRTTDARASDVSTPSPAHSQRFCSRGTSFVVSASSSSSSSSSSRISSSSSRCERARLLKSPCLTHSTTTKLAVARKGVGKRTPFLECCFYFYTRVVSYTCSPGLTHPLHIPSMVDVHMPNALR
jgi:hypothetical protein